MEKSHTQGSGKAGSGQILEIDIDAILAVQANSDDEGLTTEEWRAELGLGQGRMRKLLKIGLEQGIFVMGTASRVTFDGKRYPAKVFKYVG